jgi:hypothetical protein
MTRRTTQPTKAEAIAAFSTLGRSARPAGGAAAALVVAARWLIRHLAANQLRLLARCSPVCDPHPI